MKLRALSTVAACVAASIALSTGLPAPTPAYAFSDSTATDRLVVTLVPGSAATEATLSAAAGENVEVLRSLDAQRVLVEVGEQVSGNELSTLARRLDAAPGIARVEADLRLSAGLTPDDPGFSQQWHLGAPATTAGAADVASAWDSTTGSAAVTVAVLDTGITEHSDLPETKVLPGYDMVSDLDTANDGDERDADPSDPGDWISVDDQSNPSFYGCARSSSSWHGTHVAGIAAASANNGTGVAGVAPAVKLLPVRVLGKCGGFTQDIADGILWAAGLEVAGAPLNENPARVINLSLGGASTSCPTSLQRAITSARAAGSVVIVAAGNASTDAAGYTPANCTGAVVVAAGEQKGGRAYYSNSGSIVDILAPGSGIYSLTNTGSTAPVAESVGFKSGTSMAAPVVAGVAALMISANLSVPASVVERRLGSSARTFPDLADLIAQYPGLYHQCTTTDCGAGIVDARASVASIHVPDPPGTPAAEGGVGTATITWTEPAYTGSTPIAWYQVLDQVANQSCFLDAAQRSCTLINLDGAVRTFIITAGNEGGATSTATVTATVQSVPRSTLPPPSTTTTTTTLPPPPTTTTTIPLTDSPATTVTLPPVASAPASPTGFAVRVDDDDLVLSADLVPGAVSYRVNRGAQVLYQGAQPTWRVRGRASTPGPVIYTMVAIGPTGLQGLPATATFLVNPPPLPTTITASASRGLLTVKIRPAASTKPGTLWCVYVNGKRRGCRSTSSRTATVRLARGTYDVRVKLFSASGTSKFSRVQKIRV